MHDDDFRRIAILNRPLKLFFLAFCGIIYQTLLHRRVYIAKAARNYFFINLAKNRCISPLKGFQCSSSTHTKYEISLTVPLGLLLHEASMVAVSDIACQRPLIVNDCRLHTYAGNEQFCSGGVEGSFMRECLETWPKQE